jgi:formylglycine-generating enzyme required for sulfatase activity
VIAALAAQAIRFCIVLACGDFSLPPLRLTAGRERSFSFAALRGNATCSCHAGVPARNNQQQLRIKKTIMRASFIPMASLSAALLLPIHGLLAVQPPPVQVTTSREGNQITLSWETVSGVRYQVQQSGGLGQPWVSSTDEPLVTQGGRLSFTAPINDGTCLYRVSHGAPETMTEMVWISHGTFIMGSSSEDPDADPDELPQREVTISGSFWMGKYPVTQAEYEQVMGVNPSFFRGVRDWPAANTDYGDEPRRPVESVSWEDAMAYCAARTELERAEGRIPANMSYRLPTEAEWEYASRAGTTTRFSYGDDPDFAELDAYGWYLGNSNLRTHPVGQKLPNPWGLYDMHGHVWEWCLDWYGPYAEGPAIDPEGPETGTSRVIRGGTFANRSSWCRSSNRDTPHGATYDFGFRVVLVTEAP